MEALLRLRKEDGVVLDLRGSDGPWLRGSACMSYEELQESFFMLPPRGRLLGIVATESVLEAAVADLTPRGWTKLLLIRDSPQLWDAAAHLELLDHHTTLPWLFEPCPWLPEALLLMSGLPEKATACDLGAGSGRNALWLLTQQQSPIEWSVDCIDRAAELHNKVDRLAVAAAVQDRVRLVYARIRGDGTVRYDDQCSVDITQSEYHLLLNVRFLEKSFFPTMAHMVKQGGFVFVCTFADGAQHTKGPKNLNRILFPGELQAAFGPEQGFTVLADRKVTSDDGRPMNWFLARRSSPPSIK